MLLSVTMKVLSRVKLNRIIERQNTHYGVKSKPVLGREDHVLISFSFSDRY